MEILTKNKMADNRLNHLFKLAVFSMIFASSVFTTACSDDSAQDDKQTQTENAEAKDKKDKKKSDKKEKPAIPVEVVSVAKGNIQKTYQTITTLEAEQDAQVVARSTGLLQNIFVEEGDIVKKGQLLAQLDVEQLSLEVAQLEATTKKLKKEFNRQQRLFKRKLTSSDALDKATYEYQSQDAQYQLSKLKFNYASIRAPFAGIVTERRVKQGNLIRSNDILFKIIDPRSLKAILHLPEKEVNNIKKGQTILLQIDALNKQVVTGKIERIRPAIDTDTGTFKVVANLDDKNELLKSGMFGKVEVVFDVHINSLILEQQAVITQDNRSHVFVVKESKAIQTPVTLGFRHNGLVEIVTGLSESDKVITTGQQILKHDTKVEVIGQEDEKIVEDKPTASQSPSGIAAKQ